MQSIPMNNLLIRTLQDDVIAHLGRLTAPNQTNMEETVHQILADLGEEENDRQAALKALEGF